LCGVWQKTHISEVLDVWILPEGAKAPKLCFVVAIFAVAVPSGRKKASIRTKTSACGARPFQTPFLKAGLSVAEVLKDLNPPVVRVGHIYIVAFVDVNAARHPEHPCLHAKASEVQ